MPTSASPSRAVTMTSAFAQHALDTGEVVERPVEAAGAQQVGNLGSGGHIGCGVGDGHVVCSLTLSLCQSYDSGGLVRKACAGAKGAESCLMRTSGQTNSEGRRGGAISAGATCTPAGSVDYKYISADNHIDLIWYPRDIIQSRIESKFREKAPQVVESPKGTALDVGGRHPRVLRRRQGLGEARQAFPSHRD